MGCHAPQERLPENEYRIDSSGKIYDKDGKYKGRFDSNGAIYSDNDSYIGRIENDGKFYDGNGSYRKN